APVLPPWGRPPPGPSPAGPAAPQPSAPPVTSAPPQPSAPPQHSAPPVVSAPVADAAPAASSTTSQPPVGERPRNHWSRQAELDDEVQSDTGSISRSVGVGSATANTLVMSDVPDHDIIVSSVRSTGDILVTGSISLPASLASTGALPTQDRKSVV